MSMSPASISSWMRLFEGLPSPILHMKLQTLATWGQDTLFKHTAVKLLLFFQESHFFGSTWHAGKVDDIADIVTASCRRLKMTLPGIKTAIFLERLVVRNAALDSLSEISHGRVSNGRSSSSRGRDRRWSRLSTPGPECIFS